MFRPESKHEFLIQRQDIITNYNNYISNQWLLHPSQGCNSLMSPYMQKGIGTTQKKVGTSEVVMELLHSCHFLFFRLRKRGEKGREKGRGKGRRGRKRGRGIPNIYNIKKSLWDEVPVL